MPLVNRLYPLLVVLLAIFAVAPLEYPGAFQSQTGLLATYNLIQLDQNPTQALFWAPTIGRGYDLFRTEGLLPYLLAEGLHWVGIGYLDSIKLVYALAWIASGLTVYALARRFFSAAAALLAATVYVYLPYHIATVYLRGAFAESVAWALFPLALLSLVSLQEDSPSTRFGLAAKHGFCFSTFAGLVLIQPGLAILFALVSLLFALALKWPKPLATLARPGLVALAGLAGGAIIMLPSILRHGGAIQSKGFVGDLLLPYQLFSSFWPGGASAASVARPSIWVNPLPLQLGVVPLGLAICALALAGRNAENRSRRVLTICITFSVVLTVATLNVSAPFWAAFESLVTSPWQVLAFVGLFLALSSGAIVEFDERLSQPAMLAFFVALPVVASYAYLTPDYMDLRPTRPLIATFNENELALLDYRIVGPLRHGATLRVQMQWQALREMNHDYTVFVHAVDQDGNTWGREDGKPVEGTLPTLKWKPGQVISDTHTIQIDVEGPREGYHLEVGLYQSGNGERAIVDNGSDQLILPRPGDPEPIISDQMPTTFLP